MFADPDDDLSEYGCEDDYFAGCHIGTSTLTVVELSVPEHLMHLEHLLEALAPQPMDRTRALPPEQMVRGLCGILWDLRPRPEFYTVFMQDGSRYIAVGREAGLKAVSLLSASLSEHPTACKPARVIEPAADSRLVAYHRVDKLFIWKTGKLVKTWFDYGRINGNIKRGPEPLRRFRDRLAAGCYASVVCVDIEAYEWSQDQLLEVGISEFLVHEQTIRDSHHIVAENAWRRNGSLVADHRDSFLFGRSVQVAQGSLLLHLRSLFAEHSAVCLVGHNPSSDLKYMAMADAWFATIPERIDTYDTQAIHKEMTGRRQPMGLQDMFVDLFGRVPACMHNAGNDAHYTLCALLQMAAVGIDPKCFI